MSERSLPRSAYQTLRKAPLLAALSDEVIVRLSDQCTLVDVEPDETIWGAGADVDFVGVVSSGFVKMVRDTGARHHVAHELIGPGQVFGLMGAIEGTGCPSQAIALTKVRFYRIAKSAMIPLTETEFGFARELLRRTSVRLHQKLDLMVVLSTGSVPERLAAVLLTLAQSYGVKEGNGVQLDVPLTRADLAAMAGTTTESAIRTLSAWQREGRLSTHTHVITLEDMGFFESLIG